MACRTPSVSEATGSETAEPAASVPPAPEATASAALSVEHASGAGTEALRREAGEVGGECRGRDRHAATVESRPQQVPGSRQPALDRADRPAQPLGRLVVGQALEVAEHDRRPILLRRPTDLVVRPADRVQRANASATGSVASPSPPSATRRSANSPDEVDRECLRAARQRRPRIATRQATP